MKPATAPRPAMSSARLLVIDPEARRFADFSIDDLPELLGEGDVLVLNDAATLPGSLRVSEALELRLMSRRADGTWLTLALGSGDHRMPTEERGPAPRLHVGDPLAFGHGLSAQVVEVDATSPRLVGIAFQQSGSEFWQALYRAARPIQYAYLSAPLALWDVQNAFAARPWAVELPSAAKPLSFELLFRLERRGVELAYVTHAAGLSSTGDAKLDARLPIPERYELGEQSAARIARVKSHGARVLAVGTSVTRALEAAAASGALRAASAHTDLVLGPGSKLRVCDGLLTGMHEPGTSHFSLLEAFAPRALLEHSFRHAERAGYLQHEFGDASLISNGALSPRELRAHQALRRAS